eukprot:2621353-Pleurochrysis_carterae.AAC.1
MASAPRGRNSPNSAASDDLTHRSWGSSVLAPLSPSPCGSAGASAASGSSKRSPSPSRARDPAPPRAAASAAFSAMSWRIVCERGESPTSVRAVCCEARRGERRRGERAAASAPRRGGEKAPPPPGPGVGAARSAWSAKAPRAPA